MKYFLSLFFIGYCFIAEAQVHQRLDSLFNSLNTDGELSGAFMVVDSGKVVYEKYLGFEDQEKANKISNKSRFELASVSKQFTGMAIMQLEEKGKLSYEDDILKFFPKLRTKNVKIKHLLRNTSGIPEFLGWNEEWIDQNRINTNSDILKALELKLDSTSFPAGEAFSYSNTNYVLLALIVEKVSGYAFANYMEKYIFEPAKMVNTSVFSSRSSSSNLKNYAKGTAYDAKTKSFTSVDNFESFKYIQYFDGVSGPYGIASTIQDLLKWNQAIQNNTLLKRENFINAISVDRLNNGKFVDMAGVYYGFGWLFTDSAANENKMHFHTGGYPGYHTMVIRDFQNSRYFIALVNKWNTMNIYPLTSAVNAILQNRQVPIIEREILNEATTLLDFQITPLLGTYAYVEEPSLKFEITSKDGRIFAQLSGQPAAEVFAKNELELFYTIVNASINFSKDENGVTALTLSQNGQELKFNKVK